MSTYIDMDELVRWLGRPDSYPHHPAAVETVETHISRVFLAGEYVFKLKKPVRFDFLDFSTPALRELACREEVRLNRRLAPNTYLDVVPIRRQADGSLAFADSGRTVDWLVRMRRLPTEATLDNLFRRGKLTPALIDGLAERLIGFYSALPADPISGEEYRRRYREHLQGNRAALLAVPELNADTIRRVHAAQLEFPLMQPNVFEARVRAGRIVEGHGDLRPEHICLTDPPVIFDCIEFNPDFRRIDVADELAFLAAECDVLGLPWIGERLFQRYRERSGDAPPARLIAFYKSYRACVRAKVAALRARQLLDSAKLVELERADHYLTLADRYLSSHRTPLLLVIGGRSGTGKSTLAARWSADSGAELIRTDVIREELFPTHAGTESGVHQGVYEPKNRDAVYEAMFARARELLRRHISVVLDGTFHDPTRIIAAQSLANQCDARFLFVRCECPPEIALARIDARRERGNDPSQATRDVYASQLQSEQSLSNDVPALIADTCLSPERLVALIARRLQSAPTEFALTPVG